MTRSNDGSAIGPTYSVCTPSGLYLPETLPSRWIISRQRKNQSIREIAEMAAGTASQAERALDPVPTDTGNTAESANLHAYGCVYHSGAQRLIISQPGERAIVKFHSHGCLKHVDHAENNAGVTIREAGDYEITFELSIVAKAAAPVVFELLAGDKVLPGGTFMSILPIGVVYCRGSVMTALRADDRVGVAMTSVSVCEAKLTSGSVSAMLTVKKLD